MKVAAVVPTCRGFTVPKQSIPVDWYIVHDQKRQPVSVENQSINVVDIVAPDEAMYGRRSDSIRSAGFMQAAVDGADFILTVDDDCSIPIDWAERHVKALQLETHPWSYTVPGINTRGMPYEFKPYRVAVSHGLWDGVLDLDAKTQLASPGLKPHRHSDYWSRIHPPFAMSGMNVGFRREVLPVMYFPMMGDREPFDRFADIWCGVFSQAVLVRHGYAFVNGGSCVYHKRASDAFANRVSEAPGLIANEELWVRVFNALSGYKTLVEDYLTVADLVGSIEWSNATWRDYFKRLSHNMRKWADTTASLLRSSYPAISERSA